MWRLTVGKRVTEREGRDEECRSFFEQWYPRLYRIAHRWTGEAAGAEDLAQEILIKAFRARPRFRAESDFSTWIYRIALNHCASWKRRRTRREEILERWGLETVAPDPPPSVEERLEADLQARQVRRALAKLPKRFKKVLILREVEEQSYGEIARVLRCSTGTVSSRLARARQALRAMLEKEFGWTARKPSR